MTDPDQARYAAREMADFRQTWRRGLNTKSLELVMQERDRWEDLIVEYPANAAEDLKILEELDARIDVLRDRFIKAGERENPLAFCRPTWEQAQFINSWSPEFEPEKAPEGYHTTQNFGGKRSLKTTASVLGVILWMVPNDPEWDIFQEQEDPHGRGKYRILPRPMFDIWQRKGKLTYDTEEPPIQDRQIWHGCVDEQHWKRKVDKQYRRWMPEMFVKRVGKDLRWNLTDRYIETKWGVTVTGMLYKSDIQAWGGEELFLTVFDEGPPRAVIDEIVARSLYIYWTYTPAEPANTADRVQVARESYEGTLPMVGQVFTINSSVAKVPERITPKAVMDRRLETLKKRGEAGRVAMDGGFYDDSPRVFDLFSRERHVLPLSSDEAARAVRGEATAAEMQKRPWLEKLNGANIIRGFDEGFVHPTACVWVALLKTGERVVFREFCATSTSIKERVEQIVSLSGNKLMEVRRDATESREIEMVRQFAPELLRDREREAATDTRIRRFYEIEKTEVIRKTFGDSKLFKRDPNHLADTWGDNYKRAGLKLERASTRRPEERCSFTNGQFRANASRRHLNPAQEPDENPCGYELYVVDGCPLLIQKLERYLWEQYSTGPRSGIPTGKPDRKDDDIIDAFTYATQDRLSWKPQEEIRERHSSRMLATG